MGTAISLRGVSKRYDQPGNRSFAAVDDVSLEIQPGELFFLLGPSGCGKTTLLRMIAGFIEPTAGRVIFNDRDVTDVPPNKRNTGMVFQSYALWPHLSVESNVAFGLSVRGVPRSERQERARAALRMVQLEELAGRRPNELSGGQQQRVALARALVIRPDVLLLDEPLSNLDTKLRVELRSEIRRVCKSAGEGSGALTAVYVTHDQKEAMSIADRVAIMNKGRLDQIGTPFEVYNSPVSRFTAEFLGDANFLSGRAGGTGMIIQRGTQAYAAIDVGAPKPILARATTRETNSGTPTTCLVRPEVIRVAAASQPVPAGLQPQEINLLEGQIVERAFLGDSATLRVALDHVKDGDPFKVTLPSKAFAQLGSASRVTLSFDPADCLLLQR